MAHARNKKTGSPIVKVFEHYIATCRLDVDLFSRNPDGTLYFESTGDGADVDWSCGEEWRDNDDEIQYMDADTNIVSECDIELYDKDCPACMDQLGGEPVSDETLAKMCAPCRTIAIQNREDDKAAATTPPDSEESREGTHPLTQGGNIMKIFTTTDQASQALHTVNRKLEGRCGDFETGDNQTLKRAIEERTAWLLSWHRGPDQERTTVDLLEETIESKTMLMFSAKTEDGIVAGFVRVTDPEFGMIEVYPL